MANRPLQANAIDLSAFPTLGRVRIELATMLLLEQRERTRPHAPAVLIVAPYAVHDPSIAVFAPRHSLAQILSETGQGFIAVTFWKSATAAMRDYGIDAYLSDLNVAVDDLGGRASLVGLCQGGWLAAVYAARFPGKVDRLVLAGAPIDLAAAESHITRLLATVSPATIEQVMALAGGRVSGSLSFALWPNELSREFTAEAALQCAGDAALIAKFDGWTRVRSICPACTSYRWRNGFFAKIAWRAVVFPRSAAPPGCRKSRHRSSSSRLPTMR